MSTKEEIEVKVTTKDKVYLAIILCLLCIVALVCILVPRHFYLQDRQNNNTNQSGNPPPNNSQVPPSTEPETPPSTNPPENLGVNADYKDHAITVAINRLIHIGYPYNKMENALDSYNILDVIGLNIQQSTLNQLETLAVHINTEITNITGTQPITRQQVEDSDILQTHLTSFMDILNTITGQ